MSGGRSRKEKGVSGAALAYGVGWDFFSISLVKSKKNALLSKKRKKEEKKNEMGCNPTPEIKEERRRSFLFLVRKSLSSTNLPEDFFCYLNIPKAIFFLSFLLSFFGRFVRSSFPFACMGIPETSSIIGQDLSPFWERFLSFFYVFFEFFFDHWRFLVKK